MKKLKALLLIMVTVLITYVLNTTWGTVPGLAKFLSPGDGFWKNCVAIKPPVAVSRLGNDVKEPVTVKFDNNMVPHVFAANLTDLYFAQGYVTARDRLWQMDLSSRTAAGRLAEILGADLVNSDLHYRRIGLTALAEQSLKVMMEDSITRTILLAYTAGVNALIDDTRAADYPVEYKLLGYKPEKWSPLKSVLVFKLMAEVLSAGADDVRMSNTLTSFGLTATEELFPDRPFLDEPVIPAGVKWDFNAVARPVASKVLSGTITDTGNIHTKKEGIGSNNWAVASCRSLTGYPILANDPHLGLTLPSVWYQVQLTYPGMNVYGVSIPGIPCVTIGYNQDIAWGLTNAEADLVDWYLVTFRDSARSTYRYNDQWCAAVPKYERIHVKGEADIIDTVVYTRHGPVVYSNACKQLATSGSSPCYEGLAMRWTAQEPSNEIKTFHLLNLAKGYDDFRQALRSFISPAQNFVFADRQRNIAIAAGGKFPLRYHDQGKFILDGDDAANDWKGWIPVEQNPFVINPERGFVSSANQAITDTTYPYYISWQFANADRAKRINNCLVGQYNFTVDSLRLLQNDNYSAFAAMTLPVMIRDLEAMELDTTRQSVLNKMRSWNYCFDAGSESATFYNVWWNTLYELIWNDKFDKKDITLRWPSRDKTASLLIKEPGSHWFDDKRTPQQETSQLLVQRAFTKAVDSLVKKRGPIGQQWEWGRYRPVAIRHLAGIDAFGTGPFAAGGAAGTVNALSPGFGPSWRMVVALGPQVKGYGSLPGGQSGNPGSYYYDNLLQGWKEGRLQELLFLESDKQLSKNIISTLTIKH